ncbi:hypothetical protein DL98DRAFT_429131 [Cadophora sp. DSE1049]|nr:hypothetical protein DL98DRAFT_429131 [Cadophora sp. DSE1049]
MATLNPRALSLNEWSDCCIVDNSNVYDVTAFHHEYPGGSAIILKFAGKDATAVMRSMNLACWKIHGRTSVAWAA